MTAASADDAGTGAADDDESEAPERAIVGFHRDEEGHWVADLECGHGQHVRHDPPWQSRAWVTTAPGREVMLGVRLRCRKCP